MPNVEIVWTYRGGSTRRETGEVPMMPGVYHLEVWWSDLENVLKYSWSDCNGGELGVGGKDVVQAKMNALYDRCRQEREVIRQLVLAGQHTESALPFGQVMSVMVEMGLDCPHPAPPLSYHSPAREVFAQRG